MRKISPVQYIVIMMLPVVIAFLFLGLNYKVLASFGELVDPLEAAQIQEVKDVRYDSSIVYRPRPYKILRAKLRQRETLLAGSSRVMQFVSRPWNDKATNAGGAIRDIESAEIFFEELLTTYRPKRVILGVDWWWFAQNRTADEPNSTRTDVKLTLSNYLLPTKWLISGTISLDEAWLSLFDEEALPDGIGWAAKYSNSGWDAFGHFDYGLRLTRRFPFSDTEFRDSLEEVQGDPERNHRSPAALFSVDFWNRFEHLISNLKAEGVEIIVFSPPVAQTVYDWLENQPEPNLVKEVHRKLLTLGIPYFDFTNPDTLAIPPCEFLDGLHAGEVAYLRILRAIANTQATHLTELVDLDFIDGEIDNSSGRASIRSSESNRLPEVDFLDLGCKK